VIIVLVRREVGVNCGRKQKQKQKRQKSINAIKNGGASKCEPAIVIGWSLRTPSEIKMVSLNVEQRIDRSGLGKYSRPPRRN
jgi:hypothetical protein